MFIADRSAGLKVPHYAVGAVCAPAYTTAHSPLSFCGAAAAMDTTTNRGLTSSFVTAIMGPLLGNALSTLAQLLLPAARKQHNSTSSAAGTNLIRSSTCRAEQHSSGSKAPEEKACPPAPRAIPTNLRPRPPPPTTQREPEPLPGINKQLFGQAAPPESELELPASHPEQLVQTKIQELLQPRSPFAAKVQVAIKDFGQRFGNDCPLPLFALALSDAAADLGVRVILRTVTETKQYWSGKHGRSFLMCMSPAALATPGAAAAPGSASASCLIIDRGFREAFTTPMMTPRYKQMCASLPEVFVGQPAQLTSLLHLACYELDVMFRSLGRHVPPWRTFPAASARWLSALCSDVIVPASGKRSRDASAASGAGSREVREFLALCERLKGAKGQAAPAAGQQQPAQYPTIQGFNPRAPAAGPGYA